MAIVIVAIFLKTSAAILVTVKKNQWDPVVVLVVLNKKEENYNVSLQNMVAIVNYNVKYILEDLGLPELLAVS